MSIKELIAKNKRISECLRGMDKEELKGEDAYHLFVEYQSNRNKLKSFLEEIKKPKKRFIGNYKEE